MPSGLLSNLNVAFSLGFPRAVRVNQSQSLNFIDSLLSRNSSSCKLLRYSIVASGDVVVDTLVPSCGNLSAFVKPGGVFFIDKSCKICRKAKVSMRSGENECRSGFVGCVVFDFERRCKISGPKVLSSGRSFSSSCYSDGIAPKVSTDGSLSGEQLSSFAIPVEQSPRHGTLKLISGACYMPHPDKEKTGGEDAHFICADEQVIGVADGVGGWADVGINAGDYARELMSYSVKAIREVPDGDVDPLRVLEKAHAATRAMGSSTACIVALKNQDLHAINLGDSGFIVIRDGCLIFESPVQQHGFNYTYQLARGNEGDLPGSGQVFKIPAVLGDIVVAGSDGLFDNLYNKEIAAIVADAVKQGLSPDATARKIADYARMLALDRKYRSPFSAAAQEAGYAYCGGKLDDLTVVVSYVSA
ncbi:probable protein phosphatase 2c 55 [Phtheirospermum japonicum]|uniref:Protein phosphatase n=1 Tax=Phtheirospermum japonicum TaxID=374723 RepID=A0A830BQY4_9LAMI|nr:probable protein phosphatase 2c 55 [Phtheirospermum japonicum]